MALTQQSPRPHETFMVQCLWGGLAIPLRFIRWSIPEAYLFADLGK
jgi:hypothetical protein